jgi:hypothetical protein
MKRIRNNPAIAAPSPATIIALKLQVLPEPTLLELALDSSRTSHFGSLGRFRPSDPV